MLPALAEAVENTRSVAEDEDKGYEVQFSVPGFRSSGIAAGIKAGGEQDMAMIFSEAPASAAGLFTKNRVKAAPVTLSRQRLKRGSCQAIVVNSGCANACTGEQGLTDAKRMCRLAADALGIDEGLVCVASTGLIGMNLPMSKVEEGIPRLVSRLRPNGLMEAARAIMTTDTRPKIEVRRLRIDGKEVRLAGIAKGAGMIHPNTATMLCFILTDAVIDHSVLKQMLAQTARISFNAITVDGDTSTNDTIIAMANGMAGHRPLNPAHQQMEAFKKAFQELMIALAHGCIMDAEGATKFIEIRVERASDEGEARKIGFAVANSPLVKTAFFGEELNWGRIMAAVGSAGAAVDPKRIGIWYGTQKVVSGGVGTAKEFQQKAERLLKNKRIKVTIDIGKGECGFSVYTSDLSLDYVKINASYKS